MKPENKNSKLPDIEGQANSPQKVGGDIIAARLHLHQAITAKMKNLGFCTAPKIVEFFKRRFLWDYLNVESSKALSLLQLKDAIKMLDVITQENSINTLLTKYVFFENKRDLLKMTEGQRKKILAIAKYNFGLSHKELKEYAKKRLHRDPYINQYFAMDLTVNEADQLIKALEKWEIKVAKSSQKEAV